MERITVKEVEFITFRLTKEYLTLNEPISDFSTRFPNILESCLAVPFQSFMKRTLYPDIISKAGILFYLMIKDHPFQNGNKRIAMTTLLVFLYKNKKWLRVDTQEFYNFTMWVTQSLPKFKEEVVNAIKKFIRSHIINLNNT